MQLPPKFVGEQITYSLFFIIICLWLLYLKAFRMLLTFESDIFFHNDPVLHNPLI